MNGGWEGGGGGARTCFVQKTIICGFVPTVPSLNLSTDKIGKQTGFFCGWWGVMEARDINALQLPPLLLFTGLTWYAGSKEDNVSPSTLKIWDISLSLKNNCKMNFASARSGGGDQLPSPLDFGARYISESTFYQQLPAAIKEGYSNTLISSAKHQNVHKNIFFKVSRALD